MAGGGGGVGDQSACVDFTGLDEVDHPGRLILWYYKHCGAPVVIWGQICTDKQKWEKLDQIPHWLAIHYIPLLRQQFDFMARKVQWLVIPYMVAKYLTWIKISPSGFKQERYRQPWWLRDYMHYTINSQNLPIPALSAMQYVQVLDMLLQQIVLAKPSLGPVYLIKAGDSVSYYHIALHPQDAPNIGLIFPSDKGNGQLLAIPLILTTSRNKSPPLFCMETEKVVDLSITEFCRHAPPCPQKYHT